MNMWYEALSIVIKTIVAFFVLFFLARLMGKKQISQLTFFDYVVGISIGSVAAAVSVDRRISIPDGIVSMALWALFPILFYSISLHSIPVRRLLDGTPTILMQDGKIMEKNLLKSRMTVNDLLEELRLKDVFNIAEVEYAILETNGKLSVLKKAPKQPAASAGQTAGEEESGLFANIIIDGKILKKSVERLGIEEPWILEKLKNDGVPSVDNVLLACCNRNGKLHIDRKNNDPIDLDIFY